MSRTTVRAATATWFGGRAQPTRPTMYRDSAVQFMGTLWTAPPRSINDDDFWPGSGVVSGAVCTVHLVHSKERRRALGGGGVDGIAPGGEKQIDYTIYLEIEFHSRQQRTEAAMADFDTFLDSLVTRTRLDRTWGTGGRKFDTISTAGEEIDISPGEPDVKDNRFYVRVDMVTTATELVIS